MKSSEPGDPDEVETLIGAALEEAWREIPARNRGAVAAQRAAFVSVGARQQRLTPRTLFEIALRYAAVLLVGLFGTVMGARAVSAESLPGSGLFAIKLSLESAEGLFRPGDGWQMEQAARRTSEIVRLAELGGRATVSFVASPEKRSDGTWAIGAVPLVTNPEQSAMLANQCSRPRAEVRIFGEVRDGQIFASAVTPSCIYIATAARR